MSSTDGTTGDKGGAEILVASIVFFIMAIVFVIFLYIYVRWHWGPGSAERRSRVQQILSGPDTANVPTTRRGGLDPAALEKLPVSLYKSIDMIGMKECAVCLSELVDGEKIRLLPKCKHGFHVGCIDMWFTSHSTCPLCRDPLGSAPAPGMSTDGYSEDAANLPTNVLFWGTEDQVSTARREALVIDIPRRVIEESPASSTALPVSSSRISSATATPVPVSRLSSFKRLFSRERWGAAGSSHEGDVEQGSTAADAAAVVTKTPRGPRGSS